MIAEGVLLDAKATGDFAGGQAFASDRREQANCFETGLEGERR